MNKELILRERLAIQRTRLANQTTLLAFVRTALYFLVAGLTIDNVLNIPSGSLFEVLFIIIALVLVIIGIINYRVNQLRIITSEAKIGKACLYHEEESVNTVE